MASPVHPINFYPDQSVKGIVLAEPTKIATGLVSQPDREVWVIRNEKGEISMMKFRTNEAGEVYPGRFVKANQDIYLDFDHQHARETQQLYDQLNPGTRPLSDYFDMENDPHLKNLRDEIFRVLPEQVPSSDWSLHR
jgi:hypothetical protein